MVLSSTCTSFTYKGSDWNPWSDIKITWNSVTIETDSEWRVVGNSSPFPNLINIICNITVQNTRSSDVTFTNTWPKLYLTQDSYNTPDHDDDIDLGAWASERDITIPAGQTQTLSKIFTVRWSDRVNENTGYTDGVTWIFRILQTNQCVFALGTAQIDFWQTWKRPACNFNFTYTSSVVNKSYDYRGWPHRDKYHELNEPIQQYGIRTNPNSFSNFSPTVSGFDDTIVASIYHSNGLAAESNTPNVRIYCEQLGGDPLPLSYSTTYNINTYNKFTFTSGARQRFVNYFAKEGITTPTAFTFSIQWRNPFKNGDLAIGSLIILPDNSVYEVKRNSGSDYYQPNWQDFYTIQVVMSITPDSSVASLTVSTSYNWERIIDTAHGGKDIGCFYAPWTKPRIAIRYVAGWGVGKITVSPIGNFWQNYPSFTVNLPPATTTSQSGYIYVEQPDFYTYSFFSGDEVSKSCSAEIGFTTNNNISQSLTDTVNVYKYVPLNVQTFNAYRANSSGARSVNGDYIGILSTFIGNEMVEYNRKYNPIVKTLEISLLIDGTVVYTGDINLLSNTPWVSTDTYELGAEVSYLVKVTFADQFTTTTKLVNIGTKVTYLEFGDLGESLAVGKYSEVDKGFEIQFPVQFNKQVVILPKGVDKFKQIASVIPYDDTYNIGCTNVQEVLDWLNRRLS